jgi:hypothetical protein
LTVAILSTAMFSVALIAPPLLTSALEKPPGGGLVSSRY